MRFIQNKTKKFVLAFRHRLDNVKRDVHGLIVDEDDVELIEVGLESLLDLDVEESDLENDLRTLEAVAHVKVADAVAQQDDVVTGLQLLEVVGVLEKDKNVIIVQGGQCRACWPFFARQNFWNGWQRLF